MGTSNYISNLRDKSIVIFGIPPASTGIILPVRGDTALMQQKIQEKEKHLELLINSVPAMIFYLDAEQRYTYYNETFMKWHHVDAKEAIGVTIRTFIGDTTYNMIAPYLARAYAGKQEQFEVPVSASQSPSRWLSVVCTPDKQKDGNVTGIIVHAIDITESKRTEMALREREARFRSLIEEAPIATCLFTGREMTIEVANKTFLQFIGKGASAIGKPLIEAVPELEGQPFPDILANVFTTGEPYSATSTPAVLEIDGNLETRYFDFSYKPLRNEHGNVYGILEISANVTEQVRAHQALEEKEVILNNAVELAELGNWTVYLPSGKAVVAPRMAEWLGISAIESNTEAFMQCIHEDDRERVRNALLRTLEPDSDGLYREEYVIVSPRTGQKRIISAIGRAFFDKSGKPVKIEGTSRDVTTERTHQYKLEEKEAELRNAIELAELGTWSLDALTGKITYSGRLQHWLGIKNAVVNPGGSPRIHKNDRERIRIALETALKKGGTGRFDEEYTIINATTGAPRVIHASGQARYDEYGNAVSISGTAQDITIQRDLQAALKQKVRIRTEELASAIEKLQVMNCDLTFSNEQLRHSNDELAQYAYVASHDLQEPLRKIQVYISMLSRDKMISRGSLDLVSRVHASSERMRLLILDLLDFSRLQKSGVVYQSVNLNNVVKDILHDFELLSHEKNATFRLGELPIVEAVDLQMNQLFCNLISNSLKFTRQGVPPVISISAHVLTAEQVQDYIRTPVPSATYHKISVQDNGIGFEKQYSDHIFEIFKRLHGRETFPGSGIGLALCRKITTNHGGALYAESTPGKGTIFCLILPDRQ